MTYDESFAIGTIGLVYRFEAEGDPIVLQKLCTYLPGLYRWVGFVRVEEGSLLLEDYGGGATPKTLAFLERLIGEAIARPV